VKRQIAGRFFDEFGQTHKISSQRCLHALPPLLTCDRRSSPMRLLFQRMGCFEPGATSAARRCFDPLALIE
ncbi:hypothetical protein, partial [Xanthomonas vasicola]|uniref:hypothetical protein n=1 Tax=Xanthomonas vasicola TaxID=56459 RepID=UPI001C83C7DF